MVAPRSGAPRVCSERPRECRWTPSLHGDPSTGSRPRRTPPGRGYAAVTPRVESRVDGLRAFPRRRSSGQPYPSDGVPFPNEFLDNFPASEGGKSTPWSAIPGGRIRTRPPVRAVPVNDRRRRDRGVGAFSIFSLLPLSTFRWRSPVEGTNSGQPDASSPRSRNARDVVHGSPSSSRGRPPPRGTPRPLAWPPPRCALMPPAPHARDTSWYSPVGETMTRIPPPSLGATVCRCSSARRRQRRCDTPEGVDHLVHHGICEARSSGVFRRVAL